MKTTEVRHPLALAISLTTFYLASHCCPKICECLHLHMQLKFGRQLNDMTGSLIQASWDGLQLEASLSRTISKFFNAFTHILLPFGSHTLGISAKKLRSTFWGMVPQIY